MSSFDKEALIKATNDLMVNIRSDIYNVEETIEHLNGILSPVAETLSISSIRLTINIPPSLVEINGRLSTHTLYKSGDEVSDKPYQVTNPTGDGGICTIYTYPLRNYEWSDTERDCIENLTKFIYMIMGRARTMSLLAYSQFIDNLTGSLNQAGFYREATEQIMCHAPATYCCIFMNIKNFKFINNAVGIKTGDEILRNYCLKIRTGMDSDERFGRLGGDNFIALVKAKNFENMKKIISGLDVEVSTPEGTKTFNISARAGVSFVSEKVPVGDGMAKSSTAFLISRTKGHGDIVMFQSPMYEKAMHDKEISHSFHSALNNREFVVYYQPKVELDGLTLCGAEALVRWVRNGEKVPPMSFIPVLEREGTICELDFYVFDKVCSDIRGWLDRGIQPVKISSNFSKLHLSNPNLAEQIISTIDKYGIDHKYIEVELTEMSSPESYDTLRKFVEIMTANGIETSIDDFGTGHSSLVLLKDLKVGVIKIDKSFVDNVTEDSPENTPDKIIMRNTIKMVNELGMKAITEGVEKEYQVNFLKEADCSMVQGYKFSKPVPHDEFEEKLISPQFTLEKD